MKGDHVRVIKPPDPKTSTATGFDYAAGVVAETVESERIALQLVRIQPGIRSQAHSHGEHESAAYVLEGEVVTWYGEALEKHVVATAGDFVFIPAGVPHVAANYGETDAVALMARSDPQAQESVQTYPELDRLGHILKPPSRAPLRRAPRPRRLF
jgi:uncharacterized RmlC-like cupin family protein